MVRDDRLGRPRGPRPTPMQPHPAYRVNAPRSTTGTQPLRCPDGQASIFLHGQEDFEATVVQVLAFHLEPRRDTQRLVVEFWIGVHPRQIPDDESGGVPRSTSGELAADLRLDLVPTSDALLRTGSLLPLPIQVVPPQSEQIADHPLHARQPTCGFEAASPRWLRPALRLVHRTRPRRPCQARTDVRLRRDRAA
jgi:hypothetical protein